MSERLPLHGIHYWEFKIKARPHITKKDCEELKVSQNSNQQSTIRESYDDESVTC
jgi:hypothetical protein